VRSEAAQEFHDALTEHIEATDAYVAYLEETNRRLRSWRLYWASMALAGILVNVVRAIWTWS
jgi:hypothetical protein